ncbi:MAG: 50S ribosomal protein L4 [Methanobacteriota archaeon]
MPRERAEGKEGEKEAEEAPKATRTRARRGKAAKATKAAKEGRKEPEVERLETGRVHVYALDGTAVKTVDLPDVFRADVRDDLIRRAVTAFQANRRQAYGPSPGAGMRHSVRWSGKGQGVSRVPRIRGTMIGAQAPGTVGGRKAHPPRIHAVWSRKINERERRLARNAALAALSDTARVHGRGHRFKEGLSLPVVVQDEIEAFAPEERAAKAGLEMLAKLGLLADVERAKEGRHVRAGRGKMRGRRYRTPSSLLVVVKEPSKVRRAFGNLPGVEVVGPAGLNAEILAPGGHAGRLTVFSEGALEVLRSWHP